MTSKESSNQWNLVHIFTTEELNNKEKVQVCNGEECENLACVQYVNVDDETNEWFGCIDCQDLHFDGWPTDMTEFAITSMTHMTDEHRITMLTKCCSIGTQLPKLLPKLPTPPTPPTIDVQAHDEWQKKLKDAEDEVTTLTQNLEDLSQEHETLRGEKEEAQSNAKELKTRLTELEQSIKAESKTKEVDQSRDALKMKPKQGQKNPPVTGIEGVEQQKEEIPPPKRQRSKSPINEVDNCTADVSVNTMTGAACSSNGGDGNVLEPTFEIQNDDREEEGFDIQKDDGDITMLTKCCSIGTQLPKLLPTPPTPPTPPIPPTPPTPPVSPVLTERPSLGDNRLRVEYC